jgi:hypothetical protein
MGISHRHHLTASLPALVGHGGWWLVLLLALAGPGVRPAEARPWDDAMASVYHCATIGPSRLWLDCYYGAVGPVRVALGLPPVTDTQAQLAANPPNGTPQDQYVRDAVVREASRCEGRDRDWLDCYYAAAQPMRAALGLPPAQQRVISPAPSQASAVAVLPPGSWFLGARRGLKERLKSYSLDKDGRFTLTLMDGQVWRQVDGDVRHPHWSKPAASYVVTISRGVLGTTNLTIQGETGLYKIEPG